MSEQAKNEHAQHLASQRPKEPGRCVRCETEFVGYPDKKYCSGRCRTRAWRAERRQTRALESSDPTSTAASHKGKS